MSEQVETRWRFVHIPEPKSVLPYRWFFLGLGIALGCIYQQLLISLLGQTGSKIMWGTVAAIFIGQQIHLRQEAKRLRGVKDNIRRSMASVGLTEATLEEAIHDPGPTYARLLSDSEGCDPEATTAKDGKTSQKGGQQ